MSVRLLTIKISKWARENLCCYRENCVCSCNVFLPKCNQSISSPCVLVYVTERRWSNLTCHTVHIASVQEARGIKVGNWVSRDSWREGKQGNWKHATAEKNDMNENYIFYTSSTQLSSKVFPQELLCLITLIVSELIIKSVNRTRYNSEKLKLKFFLRACCRTSFCCCLGNYIACALWYPDSSNSISIN